MMIIKIVEPSFKLITPPEWISLYPRLIELCGRVCYKSEEQITLDSSNRFIRSLIKSGHESVLEHCSITGKFIGSRSFSHQAVRHRIASFSQESQRFCNYGKSNALQVIPPPSINLGNITEIEGDSTEFVMFNVADQEVDPATFDSLTTNWCVQILDAYEVYLQFLKRGIPPEDARSVLPNAVKTELVVTSNLREWRHIFKERAFNPHAQQEIRELMLSACNCFCKLIPIFFEDLRKEIRDEQTNTY